MAKPTPFKTPKGEFAWANIFGEGKENMSGKMKFSIDIALPTDSEECKTLVNLIDDIWEDGKPAKWAAKRPPKSTGYRPEKRPILDADGNKQYGDDGKVLAEETGRTVFTFGTDTTYPSGDPKIVSIFNAKGNKVNLGDKRVGNGSEGKVSGAAGVYEVKDSKGNVTDAGVTLYLNSIQITKFVPFTGEESWEADGDDEGWTGEGESDGWEGEAGQGTDQQQSGKGAPRL